MQASGVLISQTGDLHERHWRCAAPQDMQIVHKTYAVWLEYVHIHCTCTVEEQQSSYT